MSAIHLLQGYLGVQVAVAVAAGATHLLARLELPPASALRGARVLVLLALLVPAALVLVPGRAPFQPPVQVWSTLDEPAAVAVTVAGVPSRGEETAVLRPRGGTHTVGLVAAALLLIVVLGRSAWQGRRLVRALRGTVPWRRLGKVELRVSLEATTPYALWLPGRALVVLDEATFLAGPDRRVAVAHELQHHRQGDTRVAWLLALLRVLCLPSPAAALLARRLAELEELAVDRALLVRRVAPAAAYGRLLLRTAERARRPAEVPCAAGLWPAPSLLKRRVLMLTHRPRKSAAAAVALVLLAAGLLTTTAWAAEQLVHDRRVPAATVSEVAARADSDAFPVPDNDVVRECVDRYAGTSWGRRFLRGGMEAMADHEPLVHDALDRYGLPRELAAVPLIESGYQNLGEVRGESDAPGMMGAGIWMFIPTTARRYDLVVNATRDDRLDPVLETDAAMRLLSDLFHQFGEWPLALAGYNQGARHVREAIEDEGTDDAWELIRRGALNRYAGFVTAAVIVMEEPSLVAAER